MTGPVTTPPVSPPRDPIGKSVPKKKIVVNNDVLNKGEKLTGCKKDVLRTNDNLNEQKKS